MTSFPRCYFSSCFVYLTIHWSLLAGAVKSSSQFHSDCFPFSEWLENTYLACCRSPCEALNAFCYLTVDVLTRLQVCTIPFLNVVCHDVNTPDPPPPPSVHSLLPFPTHNDIILPFRPFLLWLTPKPRCTM